jgi:hypothetical protein
MQKLNLPEYDIRQHVKDGKQYIFDGFRKKFVMLTPEEEVRQRFARFLIEERRYPGSLMQTEVTLRLNKTVRRCDILVHKPAGNPVVLVECKAPGVTINKGTFDQAARYNMAFKVSYLLVTNGIKHYGCQVNFESRKVILLEDIPFYEALS